MAQAQQGFTVWLTGMLGAGKTTLASYVAARLKQVGRNVEVLDEDEIASELWEGLGDSKDERNTIVKRVGFVASALSRNGVAVLVAAVSPYKSSREENRRNMNRYLEVYVDCPTETLIQRDTTGLYKKALSGEIPNFVGITDPYEPPSSPEVMIRSNLETAEEGGLKIFQALLDLGYVTTEDMKVITGKRMKANPPGQVNTPTPSQARGRAKPAPEAAAPPSSSKAAARKTRPAKRAAPARPSKPAVGKGKSKG